MTERLIARRTNRTTGSTISWWRTDDGYALVCETHHHAVGCTTRREANAWVSVPVEWCPGCRAL